MTTKTKGRNGANRATQDNQNTERNSTSPDPLFGWFDLAKPSRNRQQKILWKRGNQRGHIDAWMAGHLVMLAVIIMLIVSGVRV